jgi:hypothetical protein
MDVARSGIQAWYCCNNNNPISHCGFTVSSGCRIDVPRHRRLKRITTKSFSTLENCIPAMPRSSLNLHTAAPALAAAPLFICPLAAARGRRRGGEYKGRKIVLLRILALPAIRSTAILSL